MVERVIERANDEEIEELFDGLGVADNEEAQHNMDHYFHYKLAQASRNVFFMNFIDTYYDLISEIAKKSHRDQVRREQIAEEHLAIAKAIASRDKKAAKQAVRHHMKMVDKKIESDDLQKSGFLRYPKQYPGNKLYEIYSAIPVFRAVCHSA